MAKVITFGIQKGGVGKSTTSGIISYLLASEGFKTLVVDMDSQGNVTDLLTNMEPDEFAGQTILEAFEEENIKPYIHKVTDKLHVVPADDYLATLARLLYSNYKNRNISLALNDLLEPIKDDYDFIIIDTPPSLSEPMVNAVCSSDYVVILAESSKWAFTAIPRFMETVEYAKENVNPKVEIAGILRTMNDVRRADSKAFVELIGEEYSNLVFETIIRRKAATGRIAIDGLFENKEIKEALDQYILFYDELKTRIGVNQNVQSK
ncbi:ParA family protein [Heyndrickxia acidicola]|uniref:ParA family protein n=1 Tax=Heyndrickxia acidicola TaxID=209389 RepID=A0ABU6MQS5_9BACI|nr:ParA family protein [Heyndrickxia acidicola]MED1205577.1 ParA family protein [Heyndrickxia acidicola]